MSVTHDRGENPGHETVAWFNCSAGVAGDMLLGALVDAGADGNTVAAALAGLGIDPTALGFERDQRGGIGATRAVVRVEHEHGHHDHGHHDHGHDAHPHRPAREVFALLDAAGLPERTHRRATAAYRALAEVEGEIHGIAPDDVELHEVGALDAIIDVVGTCAALESLGVDRVVCAPIAVGAGSVEAAHGTLPNPAPAVVRLLASRGAPVRGIDTPMELATPTGVALMVTLADRFGAMPEMVVRAVGFGAGTADPPGRPNVVNVVIGSAVPSDRPLDATGVIGAGRAARLVEANVDDATPEVLAHTVARLLAVGAHDAWITPIVMKKGRPAHTVHALCDDPALSAVTDTLVSETGTLGLRTATVERWPQRRHDRTVTVDGHAIRVKASDRPGRAKVEHDDAVAAAAALGLPLRDVLRRAEQEALGDRDT
ncbi:MAG: nickel pincer cofactor biosynthesis protein LarC [Ilumatobacteraceae bacterium]